MPPMVRQSVGLACFVLLAYGVSAAGGYITSLSVNDWYPGIAKPEWTPPGVVIAWVWTVLYGAMAVAAWLVWRGPTGPPRTAGLVLWGVQLALNLGWSWCFFGLQRPGLASAEILVLWVAIAATMALFFRVSRVAGALFAPYLAWVTFAAVLTWTVWRMNV
jgi:translocator protein